MSHRDDHYDDMAPLPLDDALTEALLEGRAVEPDPRLTGVTAFIAEMRASAALPAPAPSPVLAALLRNGSAPAPTATPLAAPLGLAARDRAGRSLARWRRRLVVSALGLGVGVTGVVGAGAAGLLPAPAERVIAGFVETLTPLHLPGHGPGAPQTPAGGPTGLIPGERPGDQVGGAGRPVPGSGGTTGPSSPGRPGAPATDGSPAGPTARPPVTAGTGPGAPSDRDPAAPAGPGVTAPTVPTPPNVGSLPSTTPPGLPIVPKPTIPNVSTTLPVRPQPPNPTLPSTSIPPVPH
jgi:hypothetical protein